METHRDGSNRKKDRTRLLKECHKNENGEEVPKTKTKSMIDILETEHYTREPLKILMSLTKNEGRTLLISRYGMLECGKNFKGTLSDQCLICDMHDDEEHRLNVCTKYTESNFSNDDRKIPFNSIFTDDIHTLREIIPRINQVWNVKSGHGSTR